MNANIHGRQTPHQISSFRGAASIFYKHVSSNAIGRAGEAPAEPTSSRSKRLGRSLALPKLPFTICLKTGHACISNVVPAFFGWVAKKLANFPASSRRLARCVRGIVELLEFSNDEKSPSSTTMTQQFPRQVFEIERAVSWSWFGLSSPIARHSTQGAPRLAGGEIGRREGAERCSGAPGHVLQAAANNVMRSARRADE